MPRYWLMKTEPDTFSFEDLMARPERREGWDGVRNYQARNFMRDEMKIGDHVFIYHSNTTPPHIAGLAVVVREGYPDDSAWDPSSPYHDPKASPQNPRWFRVDVQGVRPLKRTLTLEELKAHPGLAQMALVQRGQRLSVQPVRDDEAALILAMESDGG